MTNNEIGCAVCVDRAACAENKKIADASKLKLELIIGIHDELSKTYREDMKDIKDKFELFKHLSAKEVGILKKQIEYYEIILRKYCEMIAADRIREHGQGRDNYFSAVHKEKDYELKRQRAKLDAIRKAGEV